MRLRSYTKKKEEERERAKTKEKEKRVDTKDIFKKKPKPKYYTEIELRVVLDRGEFERKKKKYCTANERENIIKMSDHLRTVDKLKLDGNISENWRRFRRNFDIFMTASGISGKGETVKINTFLNAIGEEAVELFDTFTLTEAQKQSYDEILKVFAEFCQPKKNQIYERFMFYQRHQKDGEPFDMFLMDLKRLVKTCEFENKEQEMLRDQIVMGVYDKKNAIEIA